MSGQRRSSFMLNIVVDGKRNTWLRTYDVRPSATQAVEDFRWPQSLESIALGNGFDHPIEKAVFPSRLWELSLGESFNHPIEGVAWPPCLSVLNFGRAFDQPVARTAWPAGLCEVLYTPFYIPFSPFIFLQVLPGYILTVIRT